MQGLGNNTGNSGKMVNNVILNYRIEFCRNCYWKQTQKCNRHDEYITNKNSILLVNSQGECRRRLEVPWLAQV